MKRLLTRQNMIITAALLVVYIIVQVLLSTGIISAFYETNLILGGIGIIMAVSLNLITGFAGQFTLGHAGFMAIGAYFSAVMTVKWGMPFILSLLGGACLAAVMGFLIGLPTLRLKGDYLAIAT
ncbi:MAG TPA: branched-chain amino acid ABC transporter permease, partial [Peptococcaceae bacterium]|nr:branched-chain amino acid ABC transporter permease [Peptococcaceae bacterium]